MKTNLIGLAVAAAIVTSFSAFADGYHGQPPCDRPAPVAQQQRWVPGHYQQVTVSNCPDSGHGFARCHSVHLENRWSPGYYAPVEQMVWVRAPAPRPVFVLNPHPFRHPQARFGLHLGFR